MLEICDLHKSFREGGRTHAVLAGASATAAAGEVLAITGRSGSGKSTLLNLVSAIDAPDQGAVRVRGVEVSALPEPARTLYRRAQVGFVYQFFNLIPTLNALENVRLMLELNGITGPEARERSRAMVARVGLAGREDSAVDQLSGGEQQRLAIARALVHAPRLLLADEPTGNLDEATAREIVPLILSLARDAGATLLIVTHDAALAARADRALELRGGRLESAR